MKRLVMFDMDGILFDSMPFHARAWRSLLLEEGMDVPESVFYENEGRTGASMLDECFGRHLSDAEWRALYARKKTFFVSYGNPPVMPGAADAVRAARDAGAETIVVTGSGQDAMLARINCYYPGLFHSEWMVSGLDCKKGKPDPEPYLKGLDKAGVDACDAIVVENAPLGVRSGHAAGCFVAAVNTGPLRDELLLDEGADAIFHSMYELSEHITDLVNE